MKKSIVYIILLAVVAILLPSCADVSHVKQCLPPTEHTYGFWAGAWHGSISPFAFIGELFSDDIAIYAINNNGRWYDFGFVIGLVGAIKIILVGIQLLFALISAFFSN